MLNQVEDQLRSVLRERADEVSEEAVARLTLIDFRPRSHSTRARVGVGGLGAIAIAVSATVALFGVGSTRQEAFAAYSTTPTSPAPGQLTAADKSCIKASDRASVQDESLSNDFAGSLGRWKPVVDDVRGVNVLVVLTAPTASATALATCLTGPDFRPYPSEAATAPAPTAVPGTISESNGGGGLDSGKVGGRYAELLEGAAGTGVTRVVLVLSDGIHVRATVAGGYYAAWWPGHAWAVSAEVTTTSGMTSRRL
jgi:hypothetical protein